MSEPIPTYCERCQGACADPAAHASMMTTWIIKYTAIPTAHNRPSNAKVEAVTADDAYALLQDALGDGNGVKNYVIEKPQRYVPPAVRGRVVTLRVE